MGKLLKVNKLKELCKPFRLSKQAPITLEKEIVVLIEKAKARAISNQRRTIQPRDL